MLILLGCEKTQGKIVKQEIMFLKQMPLSKIHNCNNVSSVEIFCSEDGVLGAAMLILGVYWTLQQ